MSQNAARHGSHAKSEDEDVIDLETRRRERRQRQRSDQPDDDGVSPDQPDQGEFELIGDNDLGPADVGPIDPNAPDPDADSGRIRKITRRGRPRDTRE